MELPVSPSCPDVARKRLAEALAAQLRRSQWEPWDEEFEQAALEGKLSFEERSGFDWLVQNDPQLAAEFRSLKEEPVRGRAAGFGGTGAWRWGSVAAILALLLGAGSYWTYPWIASDERVSGMQGERAVSSVETIFADGFESGSIQAWANSASLPKS